MAVTRRAFTLVELLMIIIIIGVIAAISIPKFQHSAGSSKEAALRRDLRVVRQAVDRHVADTGKYPQSLANLYPESVSATGSCYMPNGISSLYGNNSGFSGPYLTRDGSTSTAFAPVDAVTGSNIGGRGSLPIDPISGQPLTFRFVAGRWNISSSASGTDSKGAPFANY